MTCPPAVLLFVLAACAASAAPAPVPGPAVRDVPAQLADRGDGRSYTVEIFAAVLEGLYRDGVSDDVVDAVIALDPATGYPANFVYACPVCMPAYDAFRVYRARPEFYGDKLGRDTFGPGLPPEQEAALRSDDVMARQAALTALVQSWMAARMAVLRLDEGERAAWERAMEARREKGMAYLESYREQGLGGTYALMQACPLCEAASGACELR